MICSYFNIAFLINQPSVDISKSILLCSTIPRIALANAELFLFIFTTVFVTKSFLHPPRTLPVLPRPRRGRGSVPSLPHPKKPKCSLPPHFASFSPPLPERRTPKPPLKGEAAQQRRRGQPRYAEYHLECTRANSYNLLAAPFGGSAAKRQRGCRWYFFEPLPFNGPHPLSQPLRAASSPIGEPRRRHEFARGFIKPQVPAATPQPLRRQLPFQGRLGGWLYIIHNTFFPTLF